MTPQRLAVIVAMLAAFPVNADELVDRADANGDGYVSLYELRAAYYADMDFNRRIEQSFADYDTDGDGLISEAERRAQAVATAETAPGAGMTATASGKTAVTAGAGTAPATASGGTAVTPVTGRHQHDIRPDGGNSRYRNGASHRRGHGIDAQRPKR